MNILQRFIFYTVQTCNIFKFIKNLYYIKKDLNKKEKINMTIIDNLKNNIDKIGVFAIKLVQWSLDRLTLINDNNKKIKEIQNIFNNYYENCKQHSFEFTKEIYKKDFNSELLDDYNISEEAIASGSIGQVYKGI